MQLLREHWWETRRAYSCLCIAIFSETAVFLYESDNFYEPQADEGISIKDDSLGIDWKIPAEDVLLSVEDMKHEMLKDFDSPSVYGVELYLELG